MISLLFSWATFFIRSRMEAISGSRRKFGPGFPWFVLYVQIQHAKSGLEIASVKKLDICLNHKRYIIQVGSKTNLKLFSE